MGPYTGSGRAGCSVLASFCISAWRDAAFRLPPGKRLSMELAAGTLAYRLNRPASLVECSERIPSHGQCLREAANHELNGHLTWKGRTHSASSQLKAFHLFQGHSRVFGSLIPTEGHQLKILNAPRRAHTGRRHNPCSDLS